MYWNDKLETRILKIPQGYVAAYLMVDVPAYPTQRPHQPVAREVSGILRA